MQAQAVECVHAQDAKAAAARCPGTTYWHGASFILDKIVMIVYKLNMIFKIKLVLCFIMLFQLRAFSKELLSSSDAMKLAFPEADAFRPMSSTAACVEALKHGKALGLGCVLEELGKHQMMGILVALDAKKKVKRVELLSYRERYGQGVQGRAFMDQFVGKGLGDRLEVGKDLDAVSGATISSKAVARGVRRALGVAAGIKEMGK